MVVRRREISIWTFWDDVSFRSARWRIGLRMQIYSSHNSMLFPQFYSPNYTWSSSVAFSMKLTLRNFCSCWKKFFVRSPLKVKFWMSCNFTDSHARSFNRKAKQKISQFLTSFKGLKCFSWQPLTPYRPEVLQKAFVVFEIVVLNVLVSKHWKYKLRWKRSS